jgi:hypothetical protein
MANTRAKFSRIATRVQGMMAPATPSAISPQTFQDVSALLAPLGMNLPEPKENFLLPEAGTDNFFGRHPMLSRGIENAMLAAASIRPSETLGEGISNVAQGLLSIPSLRAQHINNQLMAPMQQAMDVINLKSALASKVMSTPAGLVKVDPISGDVSKGMSLWDIAGQGGNRPTEESALNLLPPDLQGKYGSYMRGIGRQASQAMSPEHANDILTKGLQFVAQQEAINNRDPREKSINPITEAAVGPKPQKLQNEDDATYQGRVSAWAKKAAQFENQNKISVGVTVANARNDSRYGTFFDPKTFQVVQRRMDDAAEAGLTPVHSLDVDKLSNRLTQVRGFEQAVNQVEQNLDALKDSNQALALTTVLQRAQHEPGIKETILQGVASNGMNDKTTKLASALLRAGELSGGLRGFSGGMNGSQAMLNKFQAGSLPKGFDSYKLAQDLLHGTRQELNTIKSNMFANVSSVDFMNSDTSMNGNPLFTPNAAPSDAVSKFKAKHGIK